MHDAHIGDVIVIQARRLGDPRRVGEVLEVLGAPGHAHYRVRWENDHETIFYPGEDAEIRQPSHVPEP